MQPEYLREFIDLTGTLSFTRSAANLNIAQPTLSRHIAELEAQVGTPLFFRTTNSVRLTRAGKAFYEKAVALVSDYEGMFAAAREISKEKTVPIRLAGSTVQPTVNRIFTKLAAQAVMRGLPIRFEYAKTRSFTGDSAVNAIDLLKDGEADIILEPLDSDSENFEIAEAFEICDEELFIFASSRNPLAEQRNLKLEDLNDQTLLTYAVYRHCPLLLREPFVKAGYDQSKHKTFFIGNMLEIPEHLAELGDREFVALQKGFCESFGFGQEGLGGTTLLDVRDPRAKITFYALYRKGETDPSVAEAVALLEDIVEDYRRAEQIAGRMTDGRLMSTAFYEHREPCA